MSTRVGINGFGRIGRGVLRAGWRTPGLRFAWINDLSSPEQLAWLLRRDTSLGAWNVPVSHTDDALIVDGVRIPVTAHRAPADIPWATGDVDLVLECTGVFRARSQAAAHLGDTVRKVIVSAPGAKEPPDATIVVGVNHAQYDPSRHHVVSCASCTTNCLAPLARVLHDTVGIEHGFMTTVHAYTMDQNLLDNAHRKGDLRRARAAALNAVPTSTGAAKAVGLVLPELAGRLDGVAVRVPVPVGSLVDLVVRTERPTDRDALLAALRAAAEGPLSGTLVVRDEPLVSSDIAGDPHPCIVDAETLSVLDGRLVKALAWYDNETGFSHQMVRLAGLLGGQP